MRSPTRPLPAHIARWSSLVASLRWLDGVVGWLIAWWATTLLLPSAPNALAALIAGVGVVIARSAASVRARWRPVSAVIGLTVSRSLRIGARAWYIRASDVQLVVVTGRRRLRLVIGAPGHGGAEGISVRRTRVLLVPAEPR